MGCAGSSPATSNNPLAPEASVAKDVKVEERKKEAEEAEETEALPDVQRLFRSARDLTLACKAGVKLKESNFSQIFTGKFGLDEEEVAIKIEKKGASLPSQLRREEEIYATLKGCKGVPTVRDAFENSRGEYVMVMDLLGPSIEDAFCKCSRRFSLQTVLQLGHQMLERLEMLHSNHIIHRDIKADNFVIGGFSGKKKDVIYVIDFGLSKLYRDPKTRLHRFGSHGLNKYAPKTSTGVGSPYFSSIRAQSDEETSRRDDLESLAHVLIYLLVRGKLPWDEANKKKQFDEVLRIKKDTTIEEWCALGNGNLPPQISQLLEYATKLEFAQDPDYKYCKDLLTSAASESGITSIVEEGTPLTWDWDEYASSPP